MNKLNKSKYVKKNNNNNNKKKKDDNSKLKFASLISRAFLNLT